MSVWKSACYRDDAFQSVTKHLSEENLKIPFVQSLLDFSIEDVGPFSLPGTFKPGNVLEQVATGQADAKDLIPNFGVYQEPE